MVIFTIVDLLKCFVVPCRTYNTLISNPFSVHTKFWEPEICHTKTYSKLLQQS